jgi:LysM repeat protein
MTTIDVYFWGMIALALIAVVVFGLALRSHLKKPLASSEMLTHVASLVDLLHKQADTISAQVKSATKTPTYTVQLGDTLEGIALGHGLTLPQLMQWNSITVPNSIQSGQVLRLTAP